MLLCYQCLLYDTFHFAFLSDLTTRNSVLWDLACKEALSTGAWACCHYTSAEKASLWHGTTCSHQKSSHASLSNTLFSNGYQVRVIHVGAYVMCGEGELVAVNHMMNLWLVVWLARHGSALSRLMWPIKKDWPPMYYNMRWMCDWLIVKGMKHDWLESQMSNAK